MIRHHYFVLILVPSLFAACGGSSSSDDPNDQFAFDRNVLGDGDGDAGDGDGDGDAGDGDAGDGDAGDGDGDGDAGDGDAGDGDAGDGDGDAGDGDGDGDAGDGDAGDGDGDGMGGSPGSACDSIACGEGFCVEVLGKAACTCDSGFQDFDGDLVCALACSTESCSGQGSCDDTSGRVSCVCDTAYTGESCASCAPGFQDFDGDLVCAPACSTESCSGQGDCDDLSGSVSCSCDLGYQGVSCEVCADGWEVIAEGCGLSPVGVGSAADPYRYSDGSVAASCQEYLYPGQSRASSDIDGVYLISSGTGSNIKVTCDMNTDGGGWTLIEASTGLELAPTITSQLGGSCTLENGAPLATDGTGDSACQFDYELGFDFNQLQAFNFEVEARTGSNQTTDIGALPLDWLASCGTAGDIRMGASGATKGSLSLGAGLGYGPTCSAQINLQNGETISFSGQASLELGNSLRIEMYEAGSEAEGWLWSGGALGVRQTTDLLGALSENDPGRYDDGVYAESCADYLQTQFFAGALRSASEQQSGYFVIDSDGEGPNAEETVFCAPGGSWTPVLNWNRLTGSDSLATLLSSMTDDLAGYPTGISRMGSVADVVDAVRWSDADSSEDALSLSVDVSSFGVTEMYIEVDFYGYSMEDSGIWFSAESATSSYDLACNDHASQATNYTAQEKDLIAYSCSENSSGNLRFQGSYSVSAGENLERFRLLSLMSDINEGDYAELYRLNVAVR